MSRLTKDILSSHCMRIYKFLREKYEFCNLHMVDFITNDHWSRLNHQMQEQLSLLLALKQYDPMKCFLCASEVNQMEKNFPALAEFVREARENSWQELVPQGSAFGIFEDDQNQMCSMRHEVYKSALQKLQIHEKKQHEVEVMTEFIARLARDQNTELVIDFGSGKGYVPSVLALLYDLNVIGIESSEQNVCSAIGRNERLSTKFMRGLKKIQETKLESNDATNSAGRFIPVTTTLTPSTDISELVKTGSLIDDVSSCRALFCGLHACGDLSCTVLKHFVSCDNAAVLCLVGCCYHLLEERFTDSTDCWDSSQEKERGFPMSSLLKQQKAVIGQNARMLAMQSVERNATAKPSRSLFFRAVLQVLLREHFSLSAKFEVGRLPIKESTTFESYARKAIQKLQLQQSLKLSSDEIEAYTKHYGEWESKINAFQQLRILLAPSIECLILLDRALYLLEQTNIQSCYLMSLFDPVKSPRCLALVAAKS